MPQQPTERDVAATAALNAARALASLRSPRSTEPELIRERTCKDAVWAPRCGRGGVYVAV